MIQAQALLSGTFAQDSDDNAISTAAAPAVQGQTLFITGVHAQYSAAVAAIKTITLSFNGQTLAFSHDFTNGEFVLNFPVALKSALGGAASAALAASGTGGISGKVIVYYFVN